MYAAGAFLLYYPDFDARLNANPIVQVAKIEKVTRAFYQLYVPHSLRVRFRSTIETVNGESVALPSSIPWQFPESFSSFCYSAALAVGETLWCLYEVGHVFGRKYEAREVPLLGYTYEVPKDFGFNACGFAVRELSALRPDEWYWGSSRPEALELLSQRVRRIEEKCPFGDPELPDKLVEIDGVPWNGDTIPQEKVLLKPGDRFCQGDLMIWGFHFRPFYGIDKKGRVLSSFAGLPVAVDSIRPVYFPTAFPEPILASLAAIIPVLSLGDAAIWAAEAQYAKGEEPFRNRAPYDLPKQTMSRQASTAWLYSAHSLYYSNDRIRWFRRLLAALTCEAERLRAIHRKGGSPLQ